MFVWDKPLLYSTVYKRFGSGLKRQLTEAYTDPTDKLPTNDRDIKLSQVKMLNLCDCVSTSEWNLSIKLAAALPNVLPNSFYRYYS